MSDDREDLEVSRSACGMADGVFGALGILFRSRTAAASEDEVLSVMCSLMARCIALALSQEFGRPVPFEEVQSLFKQLAEPLSAITRDAPTATRN